MICKYVLPAVNLLSILKTILFCILYTVSTTHHVILSIEKTWHGREDVAYLDGAGEEQKPEESDVPCCRAVNGHLWAHQRICRVFNPSELNHQNEAPGGRKFYSLVPWTNSRAVSSTRQLLK